MTTRIGKKEIDFAARASLIERGYDPALTEVLNLTDEESIKKSLDTLDRVVQAKIEAAAKAPDESKHRIIIPPVGNAPKADQTGELRRAMGLRI